ncbi:hypothetical protein RB195_003987 [Necator americanus]|uniref:Uncharacterized protein n=1 Tax=Necator americanus TaxID=51031 RepID=A0ABR1DRW6_NECAM
MRSMFVAEDIYGSSIARAFLLTMNLVGIIILQTSICNSGKKQRKQNESESSQMPRLSQYRGETPEKVVLEPAGESLQDSKQV